MEDVQLSCAHFLFILGLSHKEAAPLDSRVRSNEENLGCLGDIGAYTTLCYRVYYIPIKRNPMESQ